MIVQSSELSCIAMMHIVQCSIVQWIIEHEYRMQSLVGGGIKSQNFSKLGKVIVPRHFWVQFYVWNPGNISVFVECFVFTPVPGVWKFEKSLYKGQNQKSSKVGGVTYQNLCEKGTKPTKKTRAQSDLPVKRKIQRTTRNVIFLKNSIFGWFLGFFS